MTPSNWLPRKIDPVKVFAHDGWTVTVGNSVWRKVVSLKWYIEHIGLPEVGDEIDILELRKKVLP